jgi:hypothetical protein
MEAASNPGSEKGAEAAMQVSGPSAPLNASQGGNPDETPESVAAPAPLQLPSPPASAPDTAWIEKAAQQRLDRMYAVTSAGTRTALIWLAFLVIIWMQSVQPKLARLNELASRRETLETQIGRMVQPEATFSERQLTRYAELQKHILNVDKNIQTEAGEPIELPFGIKLKSIPPIWVPLLWSILMAGLLYYLLSVRSEALTLAGRAVRLLCYQAALSRERLSDISLGAAWWLAPLPTGDGSVVKAIDLWHSLGWSKVRKKALYIAIGAFLLLTVLEGLVLYASFMLAQTVRQQRRDKLNRHEIRIVAESDSNRHPRPARERTLYDEGTLLVFATLLSGSCYLVILFKWFLPSRVPDNFAEEDPTCEATRRRVLGRLMQGAVVALACGFGFALVQKRRARWQTTADYLKDKNNPRVPRFRWKKHKYRRTTADELPAPGIYQNPKSLVIHVIAADCKHKSGGTFHLKDMKVRSVAQFQAGLSPNAAGAVGPGAMQQPTGKLGAVPSLNRRQRPRLHESDVSQLESLAVLILTPSRLSNHPAVADSIKSNPVGGAIQMLRQAIERAPTSIRLYDLLAGVAVRYKRKDTLEWVVKRALELKQVLGQAPHKNMVRTKQRHRKQHRRNQHSARDYAPTPKGAAQAGVLSIERRVKKWRDSNSRWYKKWSNTTTPVTWTREVLRG